MKRFIFPEVCPTLVRGKVSFMEGPDPKYEGWRQLALFTTIPMTLLAGPIVGYLIGDYLDRFFNTAPWLMAGFTIMGGISGVRQTILIIKKATTKG